MNIFTRKSKSILSGLLFFDEKFNFSLKFNFTVSAIILELKQKKIIEEYF